MYYFRFIPDTCISIFLPLYFFTGKTLTRVIRTSWIKPWSGDTRTVKNSHCLIVWFFHYSWSILSNSLKTVNINLGWRAYCVERNHFLFYGIFRPFLFTLRILNALLTISYRYGTWISLKKVFFDHRFYDHFSYQ